MYTTEPKNSYGSLYCSGLEQSPHYLQGMPVYSLPATKKDLKYQYVYNMAEKAKKLLMLTKLLYFIVSY